MFFMPFMANLTRFMFLYLYLFEYEFFLLSLSSLVISLALGELMKLIEIFLFLSKP